MPIWAQAGFWGLLSGSALIIGALLAYLLKPPTKVIAFVMAFGAGVLISAVSIDLMTEAYRGGGYLPAAIAFVVGALIYTAANVALNKAGARNRKRAEAGAQKSEAEDSGSGAAIALGALLDGVPESVVIGLSLLGGAGVSTVTVAAIFISNLPEGLSSAAGMRKAGRSRRYVFGVWGAIALASGAAAALGVLLLGNTGPATLASANAVAAGAILAMLADTMIPEAYEQTREYAGLVVVLGFLAAFSLSMLGG